MRGKQTDEVDMDPHVRPPESMRLLMKHWSKRDRKDIDAGADMVDLSTRLANSMDTITAVPSLTEDALAQAFNNFLGTTIPSRLAPGQRTSCYEVKSLPGLFVYPSLLPISVQIELLNKILHRDLSDSKHKNNLNIHYEIPYGATDCTEAGEGRAKSFFDVDQCVQLIPKDPAIHKSLAIRQMLDRKLRWITLGGQYDWTAKRYPSDVPPEFPPDVARLLSDIWPDIDAQAAIVNFYSPGDTLGVHRDVSEECDRGLISISIGCDAIFIAGNQDGSRHVALRLRSGDAIVMSGEARFAWHAVPRVLSDSCPTELQDWPAIEAGGRYDSWKGWLKNKRININIRQMRAEYQDSTKV